MCSREKRKQFNFGVKNIDKKLDIIYIINKFIEIDKLKNLLLTQEQLKLFNYIPRPQIPDNAKKKEQIQAAGNFKKKKGFRE